MNDLNQHTAIQNLRRSAITLFSALDTEVQGTRKAIADLNAPENRTKYLPAHLKEKGDKLSQRAKEIGALQRAELQNMASRLATVKNAWDTATLIKRARFVPVSAEGDSISADLLEELRRMRFSSDLRDATASELADMAAEAKDTKNLALLAMLKKEAGRRMYETDAERALVHVEIGKAIAEVEIDDQKKAHALIEEVALTLEGAEDAIAELLTGKEPERARMRRVISAQAARNDDGQT